MYSVGLFNRVIDKNKIALAGSGIIFQVGRRVREGGEKGVPDGEAGSTVYHIYRRDRCVRKRERFLVDHRSGTSAGPIVDRTRRCHRLEKCHASCGH